MAEEYDAQRAHECEAPVVREETGEGVEVKDRGIFDFLGKKDGEEKEKETCHGHGHGHRHHEEEVKEEVMATEFEEKVNICDEEKLKVDEVEVKERKEKKKEKKKHKLGGSDSSSSSSSDEEDEEKKKKKKEKKEKKKEKKEKEVKEEEKRIEDTAVPVEKCDEEVVPPPPVAEEKKGFLEKIKEKIPAVGSHAKKSEEVAPPPPPPPPSDFEAAAAEVPPACIEGEAVEKEKKGFLDKIKEKIPGYHPKSPEGDKEKESAAST